MSGFSNLIAEYRSNFHKIYHSDVVPIMAKFEIKRKSMLVSLIIYEIILILAAYFSFKYWFKHHDTWIVLAATIAFASSVFIFVLPYLINNKFTRELKMACVSRIIKAFGDLHWFPVTNIISDVQLNKSDLFGEYNSRIPDDAFSGTYKNVNFSVSETNLQYVTGSGRRRHSYNVFKGVIINFNSNKVIRNKTIITSKGDKKIMRRNGTIWITIVGVALYDTDHLLLWCSIAAIVAVCYMIYYALKRSKEEVLKEIKLEDPEFNKKYKAYSSDEIEGRYLITPAFMERFKNIQTAFGADKIKCSFYDDYLMFAISSNRNVFEIGSLFKKLNNPKQLKVFFEELISIFVLVDYFKLDEKTGL